MIYFDNAATSFPKPKVVLKAVKDCLENYCGNPSRGSHNLSYHASEAIYNTRLILSEFFNIKSEENIVFTHNATYALNIAIKTLLKEGSHVITSDVEHNSVIRVLEALKNKRGIEYSSFNSNDNIKEQISGLVKNNSTFVICNACSNVTGKNVNLYDLSSACKEEGLGLIIDASQAAGHYPIDISKIDCDALCAPAHKSLFGIQGCGFAIFPKGAPSDTFIEGGSGNASLSTTMPQELPDKLEGGTLNVPGCVSLHAGINYIQQIGIFEIEGAISKVREYITERLGNIKEISTLISNGAIISFNVGSLPSTRISSMLNREEICTRSGLHCAPAAHRKLGTLNQGTVRLSFSYFNTIKEANKFCDKISAIIKELKINGEL